MVIDNKYKFLFEMIRIRLIEEKIASEYKYQEIRCPVHLSIGQEAIPVGISATLAPEDKIVSAHRSHALKSPVVSFHTILRPFALH